MFDINQYHRAESLEQAVQLLSENPAAKLIAGGTDVLVKLRHFSEKYSRLIDIHDLPQLKEIKKEVNLFLGAGLTFTRIIDHSLVQKYIPVLAEASATVAGPQIRNMGTVGGNIANGATSADTAAPLLVLEPRLHIQGPAGRRLADMTGFHQGPGRVALEHNEVLVGFEFDLDSIAGLGAAYYKYAMRAAMDIATIGCAAGVKIKDGLISDLRLALTVAAPTPIRCRAAEAAGLNRPLDEKTISDILEALDHDIQPRTSWRASREFRTRIIKTLAERMIKKAAGRAGGGA